MFTFFKVIWGTAHFKTRFLNFIESNPNIAKKVIYFVDNDEIYEEYKLDYNIVSLDSLRENHEWSNTYEIFYKESNDTEYVRNFWDFYREKNTLLPNTTFRFVLLYMYEKNILKFKYLPNNSFITDNELLIDNYFNTIEPAMFTTKLGLPRHYINTVSGFINDYLKLKFPHLILPKEEYWLEIQLTTFSFENKDHLMLFYDLWDSILKVIFEEHIHHFFQMNQMAYLHMDDVIGYIFRIFEINFNYKIDHWHPYWDQNTLGFHKTTWHDNWYYKYSKKINNEYIHYPWGDFGDFVVPVNPTIETYIERNKELINIYFNHHFPYCNCKITENNQVKIKFLGV
jgi:hypothetical protein